MAHGLATSIKHSRPSLHLRFGLNWSDPRWWQFLNEQSDHFYEGLKRQLHLLHSVHAKLTSDLETEESCILPDDLWLSCRGTRPEEQIYYFFAFRLGQINDLYCTDSWPLESVLDDTVSSTCPKHPETRSEAGRLQLELGINTEANMHLSTLTSSKEAGIRWLVTHKQDTTPRKLTSLTNCSFSRRDRKTDASSEPNHNLKETSEGLHISLWSQQQTRGPAK